jgi:hypothetical protein
LRCILDINSEQFLPQLLPHLLSATTVSEFLFNSKAKIPQFFDSEEFEIWKLLKRSGKVYKDSVEFNGSSPIVDVLHNVKTLNNFSEGRSFLAIPFETKTAVYATVLRRYFAFSLQAERSFQKFSKFIVLGYKNVEVKSPSPDSVSGHPSIPPSIAEIIFKEKTPQKALESLLEKARSLTHADKCFLFKPISSKDPVLSEVFLGFDYPMLIPSDSGIVAKSLKTGLGYRIEDASNEMNVDLNFDSYSGVKPETVICVPVFGSSDVIMVTQLINKNDGSHFTEEDLQVVQLFNSFVAFSLQKSSISNSKAFRIHFIIIGLFCDA